MFRDEPGRVEWWREAVLYQIYPRSFADSNGDGVGDIQGIIGKLDYLGGDSSDSLGVDAIWLAPLYPSPQADFGYDISDYQSVDPVYGSLADFDELVAKAHSRGIRIVIDLVMNHTSDAHEWFAESRSSRDNPKRDWYIWADPGPDGGPPNNWLSSFERCGSAWCFDEHTGQYYLHSFTPRQPDLNWRNPEVLAAMREVWRFWLDRGVDGFRVDVAHRLLKDAELRDNPPELARERRHVSHPRARQRNLDLPEVHDVLRALRRTLDEYGDRFALGEVPISDDAKLSGYFGSDGMQTVFHIAFWEQPWRAGAFRAVVDGMAEQACPGALATYALATHDISRFASRFGRGDHAAVAAMMLLTLRGVPCLYYGEEIGMADAPPATDRTMDVDGRDGTRVPMRWDASGAGFSSGIPWLAPGVEPTGVTVVDQDADAESLLNLYRRLIRYRRSSPALRGGDYRSLATSEGTFAYLRSSDDQRLLVALNFTADSITLDAAEVPDTGTVRLSTLPGRARATVDPGRLRLGPDEGVLVELVD